MPPLANPLAQEIARQIRQGSLTGPGALAERRLAGHFHVSRTPVRVALRELAAAGVLVPGPRGGLRPAEGAGDGALAGALDAAAAPPDSDETVYLAIARDRLAGDMPDRISENALIRRYGLTRPRTQALLRRMAEEGWAERLPGNGWRFLPVLTSMQSYRQSYSFRQAIEPAGLRDPGFQPNRPELARHLKIQHRLVAGEVLTISAVDLFRVGAALHEAIMECSGNAFSIEALRRVNRLRRLIEYGQSIDREQARRRCAEHVAMLEMILDGRHEAAAVLMDRHLAALGPIKAP